MHRLLLAFALSVSAPSLCHAQQAGPKTADADKMICVMKAIPGATSGSMTTFARDVATTCQPLSSKEKIEAPPGGHLAICTVIRGKAETAMRCSDVE